MGRIYLLFQNHKKMKSFSYTLLAYIVMQSTYAHAQNATTDTLVKNKMSLSEFVLSANKVNENKNNVAQQVTILNEKDIANAQAQSTADLMSSAANLFVQKSQLGGGSPVIRGFEANRIQMVVDGVRMNNLIYRAGHLQNIVTIDNSMLSKVEVLSGPSSTIW
jgi:hemoglobin/transferrin/lactoferrin receptor protein